MKKLTILTFLVVTLFSCNIQSDIPEYTLKIDYSEQGNWIKPDFAGLSYETKLVLPDSTGKYYFSANNASLVEAYKTLGVKHLRVGGNTAERATVPIPDETDIDTFYGFAKVAGLKTIYTVRMDGNTPDEAARIAKYVYDNYAEWVECITVGNEPNKHFTFSNFVEIWTRFTNTISEAVPYATYCAPSTTPQGVEWSGMFARELGQHKNLAYLTQHDYPGRDGDTIASAAASRKRLLSPAYIYKVYNDFYNEFVPDVKKQGIKYRLEEANSFGHGGAVGVSDTYTASLWIIDYLYWFAWHDAIGINFHTGQKVMRGQKAKPNVYTALNLNPDGGVSVLPTGYGIKMFNLGSNGKLTHTSLDGEDTLVNVVSYAVKDLSDNLFITLLNREYGPDGTSIDVKIPEAANFKNAASIMLQAPGSDITSITGITIGGKSIAADGTWDGQWTDIALNGDALKVHLPAASCVVVKLSN